MKIYCCQCHKNVCARIAYGNTLYPHRSDLKAKQFWQCPTCKNFVGCHPNTNIPLGSIAFPALKKARNTIHKMLDPIWQQHSYTRSQAYAYISKQLGYTFHTSSVNTLTEAERVKAIIKNMPLTVTAIDGDFI